MQRFQRLTINVVHHLILRSAQDDINLCSPNSFLQKGLFPLGVENVLWVTR